VLLGAGFFADAVACVPPGASTGGFADGITAGSLRPHACNIAAVFSLVGFDSESTPASAREGDAHVAPGGAGDPAA